MSISVYATAATATTTDITTLIQLQSLPTTRILIIIIMTILILWWSLISILICDVLPGPQVFGEVQVVFRSSHGLAQKAVIENMFRKHISISYIIQTKSCALHKCNTKMNNEHSIHFHEYENRVASIQMLFIKIR